MGKKKGSPKINEIHIQSKGLIFSSEDTNILHDILPGLYLWLEVESGLHKDVRNYKTNKD